MTTEDWWQSNEEAAAPRARWLVFFHRELPLREHHATTLTIPVPHLLAAGSLEPALTAENACALPFTSPGAVLSLSPMGHLVEPVRGTVSLDTVLLGEFSRQSAARPRSVEDQIWEAVKLKERESEPSLARRLAYLLQPPKGYLLLQRETLEWAAELFPYQIDGVSALVARQALLLADDMGLGKTIQAIAALRLLIHLRRVTDALIVAPASLVTQWRKEVRRWAPELRVSTVQGPAAERAYQWSTPAHVFLTSYETLREDFTANPQSPPRRRTWGVVILDEAQKIKNRDTEISRKCKQIPRKRAWVLTGTPLENAPDDLASILEFVRPLGPGDQLERIMPGPRMLQLHRELQLRRKKADVLPQLPPKTVSTIALPLLGRQRVTYEKAEREGGVGPHRKRPGANS